MITCLVKQRSERDLSENLLRLLPTGKHQQRGLRVTEDTPAPEDAARTREPRRLLSGTGPQAPRAPKGSMAHAGRTGYDNREIVMKYIHYKLSQRGYEWDAGDAGAAPAPGVFSSQLAPAAPRDPAARTSPPPPPPAAAGPALSPVPPVVHLTLRQAGDDFSRRYRRDFAEMSSQLHLTPFTARGRFATVVEELFRDGVNWGRIVAFFEFGGVMCVESVNREMSPLVDNIALWMTEYLNRHLHTWIQDNGGWDAFVELYGPSVRPLSDFSWVSLKTLLSLALVGACITLGAYLGHK